ncbi:hypothetical protein [Sporosarcina highlanderae]|uniref:Uncharacterized protein n=1 Tax=Sporosarcina highlanderae TaxID=3035916 RepID=A0ABT8JU10_9BACL|nr:hypothetical protein [Sporosarcina highlanderae]MDN4608646.1 hypothetical protein [Sporosarcina highlanderae]
MDKVYQSRVDQLVLLGELLEEYFLKHGDITPALRRKIIAYRFALAIMKADDRLAPAAKKFSDVISAIEKNNFKAAAQYAAEALALGEGVIT